MSLTCECGDWYPEPGGWWWDENSDYTTIADHEPFRVRRVRCCSCKELIGLVAVTVAFPRWKIPDHDIEISIYGEEGEIPMATRYMCERCSDLYFSLASLGFCEMPGADQRELVKEYAETYGTKGKDDVSI